MQIFPAIDLLNGRSVRLFQGDYDQVTPVASDPVVQAQKIQAAGLKRLHLVDLDGAKAGWPMNQTVVQAIRQATDLTLEIGGGLRDLATIQTYLAAGIQRVILGSVALKNPTLVQTALQNFGPDRIVIGIDGQNGQVATEGWLDQSQVAMPQLIDAMVTMGAKNFIVTDIHRDGAMTGPNLTLLKQLQTQFSTTTIVASGGIRNYQDLTALAQNGLTQAIIGKALVTGDLTLAQLVEAEATLC